MAAIKIVSKEQFETVIKLAEVLNSPAYLPGVYGTYEVESASDKAVRHTVRFFQTLRAAVCRV